VIACVTGLAAFALYWRTLAPDVLVGDSGEFQFTGPILGIPHPTGYPLYTLLGYLWSLLWPTQLAVFYPYNRHPSLFLAFLSLAALVIVSAVAILIRRHKPYVLTGWFWFLITLVPVIGIVQVGLQSMADRYTYIPLIGLFIILAWGGRDALNRLRIPRFAQALAVSIALVLCAGLTRAQLRYWHDSVALFQHAVNVTADHGPAEANLGYALAEQGQDDRAIAHYKAVLKNHPRGDATVWNNFGGSLAATGKLVEAIDAFQNALKLDPSMGDAHENLGLALARKGRLQEALIHFRDAARLEPENVKVHNAYAVMLGEAGRTEEAMREFQIALQLAPDSAATHANFANLLAKQHARDEAMAQYSEALRLNPGFVEAHYHIASLLREEGRTEDATRSPNRCGAESHPLVLRHGIWSGDRLYCVELAEPQTGMHRQVRDERVSNWLPPT